MWNTLKAGHSVWNPFGDDDEFDHSIKLCDDGKNDVEVENIKIDGITGGECNVLYKHANEER